MGAPASAGATSTAAAAQPTRSSSTHPSHSHNVPLSARRSTPLDLSTVERRGQPNNPREPSKRIRPHGIPEAPTFRPTEEEFKDPVAYIQKIAPEGKKYGICRVIPPEGWQPTFAIDTERFHFKTRRQELNSVEGGKGSYSGYQAAPAWRMAPQRGSDPHSNIGNRANMNYVDGLAMFHKQHGTNYSRLPSVDKRPLDLYKLKKAVESRGGFESVCKTKKWAEIGRDLGYSGKIMSSLSTSLKNSYQRYLQPSLSLSMVVHTPPSPLQSPMTHKPMFDENGTPSKVRDETPSLPRMAASHTPMAYTPVAHTPMEKSPEKPTPPIEPTPPPSSRPAAAGFTPVNSGLGGFTAVNRSPFTPGNNTPANNGPPIKREGENGTSTPQVISDHASVSTPMNGQDEESLKRAISREDSSQCENGDDDDGSGRRNCFPTVAGSHMSLLRPAPVRSRKDGSQPVGEKCETCGKSDDQGSILVCDGCELGYHKACLDPSTTTPSEHDWHCPKCLVGTGEFGFEDGGVYSLKQFQEKANEFKKKYFASKMPFDPVLNTHRRETEDDVEAEFWKLVVDLHETVEVEYGADIHSTTHGSGFPTIERNPLDPFSSDPWNLNVLPFYGDSLFRYIKSDISGMTVPWVYVGMCFSTFCWHNEDHYAYSANYQHFGATKTWYGIPGADAEAFETAMRDAVPELFEGQPDLLFQLVTLMPPDKLRKAGVNVYAVDQRAGQFVLTFPQAYHAGFNHGFNFNEAVNFAPTDWEPYGAAGVERLQNFRRHPCFSHDELLLTAAARDTSIATAKWLAPALARTCTRELGERAAFLYRQKEVSSRTPGFGPDSMKDDAQPRFVVENEDLPEDDYQCQHCKAYAYLTQFRCHKSGKTVCLSHVDTYDCCGETFAQKLCGSGHTLRYRMSDDELQGLVQKVQERARIPEAWSEKLDKTLEDEPKPQLKALHNLLNEAQLDERDREVRRIEHIYALQAEADKLSFDCPQMAALEEKTREIEKFQQDINNALMHPHTRPLQEIEELIERGKNFNVEVPELEHLEQVSRQIKWIEQATRKRDQYMTLTDCRELLAGAEQLGLSDTNEHLVHFKELARHGDAWEMKAKELMSVEAVHYQQLEALSAQASRFPVSPDTLAAVDAILTKQREAQKRIQTLYEKSKDPEMKNRPKYKDIRDLMESLEHLTSRPIGAIDLEREQKRHEDWMRKGKKALRQGECSSSYSEIPYGDSYRPPVEPSSRDNSPEGLLENPGNPPNMWGPKSRKRDVFCICRHSEAGMMIECEVCHEWYHGKCLKIARGKVKEFDKYTCPICDWRQKIPRDAARPKLEDLQDWHAEIATLPFQPEEEEVLESIINQATAFRDFLHGFTNAACTTTEEVPTLIFYLRKIEGAEVLLTFETNFFRQEIHKWAPVAPEPPPILEQSLSTRKPRPTKQQKIMAQLGVNRPEDLPEHLRPKHIGVTKRKSVDAQSQSNVGSDVRSKRCTISILCKLFFACERFHTRICTYLLLSFSPPRSRFSVPPHSCRAPPPPQPDLETSLFSPPRFGHDPQFASSSPRQNLDDVFADLTNQEIDPDAENQAMENTHANEALEALVVSNGSSRAGSVQEESAQNGEPGEPHGEPKLDGTNGDLEDEEL
ncbi:Zinc finger PHD-type [Penicillium expansum]|nr:Zinc finger PHD-type [Penicillium expansum]